MRIQWAVNDKWGQRAWAASRCSASEDGIGSRQSVCIIDGSVCMMRPCVRREEITSPISCLDTCVHVKKNLKSHSVKNTLRMLIS